MRFRGRFGRGQAAGSRIAAAAVLALIALLVAASAVSSAPERKRYTATIAPTSATAGTTATVRLTITNDSTSTQAMGSANVVLPTGVQVTALGSPITPAGVVWSATLVDGVIQLRSPGSSAVNRIAPGGSVALDVTLALPAATGTLTFATKVKQSNDFSGSGNDFTRVGPDPALSVTAPAIASITIAPGTATITAGASQTYVATARDASGVAIGDVTASTSFAIAPNGSCSGATCSATTAGAHTVTATRGALSATASLTVIAGAPSALAFGVQPTATVVGAAITPAVTVRVQDQYGNLATGSTATVSTALGANPGGATLGGTTARSATGGTATFGDLSVSASGTGYTLTASSPGLQGATSASFDVPLVLAPCLGATGCQASTGGSPTSSDPTVADVLVPPGGKDGILLIGSDPASADPDFCGGSPCVGLIMTVLPPGSDAPSGAVRVTLTYAKAITGKSGVNAYTTYADFGAGPKRVADCRPNGTPVPPCVAHRSRTGVGDLVITLLIPFAIDPRIGLG